MFCPVNIVLLHHIDKHRKMGVRQFLTFKSILDLAWENAEGSNLAGGWTRQHKYFPSLYSMVP